MDVACFFSNVESFGLGLEGSRLDPEGFAGMVGVGVVPTGFGAASTGVKSSILGHKMELLGIICLKKFNAISRSSTGPSSVNVGIFSLSQLAVTPAWQMTGTWLG